MCRIASLCLLQRLKGNMSATHTNSTTWRRELSSSFFFLQGNVQKEIHAILTGKLGEHAPSYATVKNWVAQFKQLFFHL